MPNYKYICTNEECGQYQEILKSITVYDRPEYCLNCGTILKRAPMDLVCGYKNDKDFYGKTQR